MITPEGKFTFRAKLTVGLIVTIISALTALVTTSFTMGSKVNDATNQRNQNTAEIAQIKKLDEERDHRIDEIFRTMVAGFAELRAQMQLVLPRVFPPGKTSWWLRDDGIFARELVASSEPSQPQAEFAPFQPKVPATVTMKDRLVALENLRQRIIEVRSRSEQLIMSEQLTEPWKVAQAKIDERHALEIEYEKLKTQEVILTREILSAAP